MRTYIIQRLLLAIPTLLAITFISYGLMHMAPGDPVRTNMIGRGGEESSTIQEDQGESEAAALFRKRFHLDRNIIVGYSIWLWNILRHNDFGVSITVNLGTPVLELISRRVPPTFKLNLISMAIIYMIAIPAGIFSAVRRGSMLDRTTTLIFFVLYSLPSFWVGLMLLIAAATWFPSWPTTGLTPRFTEYASYWTMLYQTSRHYVLPVFCLSFASFAALSRYARSGLLEVVRQDYIRTARAKGCSDASVILKHALRNSLIPIIVIMAGMIPGLIGGSLIIEYIFGIEGMGDLMIVALSSRDYPVLMTLFSINSLLVLLGILVSDLMLSVVDPRISYDRK